MPGELINVATDFLAALDALDADRMKQMLTEDARASTRSRDAGCVAGAT